MLRKLKLLARPYGSHFVEAIIIEQSHRGSAARFTSSNGILFHSAYYPEYQGVHRVTPHIALRGVSRNKDHISLRIPIDMWDNVKDAVMEYNLSGVKEP